MWSYIKDEQGDMQKPIFHSDPIFQVKIVRYHHHKLIDIII